MSPAARRRPAAQTRIIKRGRGHSYLLDGEKCRGVTTILGNGLPKPALIDWAGRTVAETAVQQRDKWDDMAEGAAIEFLKAAPRSDRDKAANRGTQVHTLAEGLTRGAEVEVPEELVGHVDSYIEFLEDWAPADPMIELVVGNRQWKYMGRLDLIATLGGERWLLDIKTNRSGPFAETALQLAAYRNAEFYLDSASGEELPMPAVDRCGVVWVRTDGYDLFPYKAGPDEFRSFLYVAEVARFMDRDLFDLRGEPIYPKAEATR